METTMTVGEIAASRRGAVELFEGFGIDYCCGGKRSLDEACAASGVAVEKVLLSLESLDRAEKTVPESDWETRPVSDLIDHILEKHHTFTRRQLERLVPLAVKVRSVHGDHGPHLAKLETVVRLMAADLENHLLKEERVLFPTLKASETARTKGEPFRSPCGMGPLFVLRGDHEATGRMFEEIRGLTGNLTPPSDACGSYRALYQGLEDLEKDIHRHVHLENNVLFVRVEREGLLE